MSETVVLALSFHLVCNFSRLTDCLNLNFWPRGLGLDGREVNSSDLSTSVLAQLTSGKHFAVSRQVGPVAAVFVHLGIEKKDVMDGSRVVTLFFCGCSQDHHWSFYFCQYAVEHRMRSVGSLSPASFA